MSTDTHRVRADLSIRDEPVHGELVAVEEVADYGQSIRDEVVVDVGGATFRVPPESIEFV